MTSVDRWRAIKIATKRVKSKIIAGPFAKDKPSVRIQAVLYNNNVEELRRSLQSIERMVEVARGEGICSQLVVAYGDSSPLPVFTNDILNGLREEFSESIVLEYTYFNSNLGSAGGHNTLNESNNSEFLLLQNPDVIVSSRMLEFLMKPFLIANVGIVEAKQMPIEHSKEYDPITGETSWASGACTLIPTPLFNHISGYDSDTFFLYCDDVDLSWMVVEAGFKVIVQPYWWI